MTRIASQSPKDGTPHGLDGVILRFPFTVTQIGRGALKDTHSEHSIAVEISRTLMAMWGFSYDALDQLDFQKTLFEFARREAIGLLVDGLLDECHEIRLMTNTAPPRNPFDPAKIPDPSNWISPEFKIDEVRNVRAHRVSEPGATGSYKPSKTNVPSGDGWRLLGVDLPFSEDVYVNLDINRPDGSPQRKPHRSLRNTVLKYEDPFGSVAEDDWDALK
ncbi:MAG: hypothetical protein IH855_11165 [Bacteroidetes bacterium]|nr:hypothetical protein [Bacteroidota bacterium]